MVILTYLKLIIELVRNITLPHKQAATNIGISRNALITLIIEDCDRWTI